MRQQQNTIKSKMINDIMRHFDFTKVYTVMYLMDWKWYIDNEMRVPNVAYIRDTAIHLLKAVTENFGDGKFHMACQGGLIAALDADGTLSLQFVLEEMSLDSRDFDNN